MPKQAGTQVVQPQQQKSGGGILRSLLRPFMPEVSAGLDAVSGLLHGDASQAAGAVAGAVTGEDAGNDAYSQAKGIPEDGASISEAWNGAKQPASGFGEINLADPSQGQAWSGAEAGAAGGEESNPQEAEPDQDEDDVITPEQMQSIHELSRQFPKETQELLSDPSLVGGMQGMLQKIQQYLKTQQGGK